VVDRDPMKGPSPVEGLFDVLGRSRDLGFLGPGPIEAHLDHARAMAEVIGEPGEACVDLGAGGGVPGLALAVRWPATSWCLLDAAERRVAFLEASIAPLGLIGRVRAVCARAEEVVGRGLERDGADLVVARGFGPPAVTAECAAPLLAVGGRLVVSEPPGAFDEGRWPPGPLASKLGLRAHGASAAGFAFVVLAKEGPSDPSLPRRVGLARRRPLF
jgi:16S rRNA (guanine527-N7)-methyltransferase